MEELFNWLMERVIGRFDGPFSFRLYLQPLMAIILAVRDGRADAKAGRVPFFWSLFTEPENRGKRIREGWKSVRRVFWFAVVIDLAYQFLEMPQIRPLGAILVAIILAIIPYLLIRGTANRILTAVNRRNNSE